MAGSAPRSDSVDVAESGINALTGSGAPADDNSPNVTAAAPTEANAVPARSPGRALHLIQSVLGIVVVAVTIFFIVLYGLPKAPITTKVPQWVYTTGDAITLNQNWALFAPDPPSTDVQLDFVVTDANGEVTVESLPSGPAWLPTARSERWRKVRERVTPTSAAERWQNLLTWSQSQLEANGRNPQTIELRRRWIDRKADDPTDAGTEKTFTFARLDIPSGNYVVLDPDAPGAVTPEPDDASPDGRVEKTDQ